MQKAKRWMMREQRHVALEEFDCDMTSLKPREIAVRADFTAISPGTECANYLALDPDVLKPLLPDEIDNGYHGAMFRIAVGPEDHRNRRPQRSRDRFKIGLEFLQRHQLPVDGDFASGAHIDPDQLPLPRLPRRRRLGKIDIEK
jgi:hypothetical protein